MCKSAQAGTIYLGCKNVNDHYTIANRHINKVCLSSNLVANWSFVIPNTVPIYNDIMIHIMTCLSLLMLLLSAIWGSWNLENVPDS